MKIFDAHMHLPVNYPSLEDKKNALLGMMKRNGVSKGVVISDSELESGIGSMEECVELFTGCGDISVVGGISPFIDYRDRLVLLEGYLSRKVIVGIKLYCGHEPVYLDDTVLAPVFELARRYGAPVLFHSGWDNAQYSSTQVIENVARENPDVTFVCCHCTYPNLARCFDKTARHQNVYYDVSSTAEGGCKQNLSVLEKAVSAMPERFIFGSDYASCSQEEHIEYFSKLSIGEREMEMLFYKNTQKLYRL